MKKEVVESMKFPPVITKSPILGVDEGTVLKFNYTLGKYLVVNEFESNGPEENYYYSGSAFAIDPYLVKENIGDVFEYLDIEVEVPEDKEPEMDPNEVPGEEELKNFENGHLIMYCGACGNVTSLSESINTDFSIYFPLNNKAVGVFVCDHCGNHIELSVKEDIIKDKEDDESEEKSD